LFTGGDGGLPGNDGYYRRSMSLPRQVVRRLRGRGASRPGESRWARQLPTPSPCPAGWDVGPPDFVGIGAQKAGTTWWFHLIATHPDVYQDPAQRPELHYWDHFSHRWPAAEDIAAYHRLFPRPPGKKSGEKTPDYLHDYWAVPMIKLAAPDARIIVLLRDPIERYRSAVAHGAGKGWTQDRLTENDIFNHGLYGSQLTRLYDTFDREQVLVLQYERCVRDAPGQLERTQRFLGLPSHEVERSELERRRNAAPAPKAEIEPARLSTLRRSYEREVSLTCALVPDLDLSLWPNFSGQA